MGRTLVATTFHPAAASHPEHTRTPILGGLMFRSTTLSAVALLGAALLAPTGASAAGETCHGQPATIVGAPGTFTLVGTEGPDVIVTNGSMELDALGGDDLVCVTVRPAQVVAGDGDDVVDTTGITQAGGSTYLGAGSDRFVGGAARDAVYAGAGSPGSSDMVDTERDVIATGPAAGSGIIDRDGVTSGQAGQPNADVIRMDNGGVSWRGVPADGAVIDGGSGSSIGLDVTATDAVAIDTRSQTVAFGAGPRLSMSGFTGFYVLAKDGPASFDFVGSDRDEELTMEFWDAAPHTVDMGAGDDDVHYYSYGSRAAAGASYTGGAGRDELELTLPDEVDLDLDLRRGRLALGPKGRAVAVPATGFEDATLMAEDIEVVGTDDANEVYVYACRARVDGRKGRDRLLTFDTVMDEGLRCKGARATFLGGRGHDHLEGTRGRDRLFGGRGNDVMEGDPGRDLLVGGPGRDKARGGQGRDTCDAERTRSCEVRR